MCKGRLDCDRLHLQVWSATEQVHRHTCARSPAPCAASVADSHSCCVHMALQRCQRLLANLSGLTVYVLEQTRLLTGAGGSSHAACHYSAGEGNKPSGQPHSAACCVTRVRQSQHGQGEREREPSLRRRALGAGRPCCRSRAVLPCSSPRRAPDTLSCDNQQVCTRDRTQLSGAYVRGRAEDEREKEAALAALPQGYYDPEFDAVATELGVLRPAFSEEELEAVVEARAAALEVVSERLSAHVLARYDSFIEGVAEVGQARRPPGAACSCPGLSWCCMRSGRGDRYSNAVGACAHALRQPQSAHGRAVLACPARGAPWSTGSR